jgi:DNA-binding response OmpR family regulator
MAISSCWADEQGRELVDRFGAVWEDEVEKIVAYESLQQSESKERILDAALDYIQKTARESRILARGRWKVRFPSRRTTVGCYGRILAEMNAGRLVINGVEEDAQTTDDPVALEEKARQHLDYLLELLSTHATGVWGLEREMIQTAGIEHFGQDYGQTKQTN